MQFALLEQQGHALQDLLRFANLHAPQSWHGLVVSVSYISGPLQQAQACRPVFLLGALST